jgi:electron transfer flavoprotein alpha subunit
LSRKIMGNGVWVFIENNSSTIEDVSLELLWKGRELADQLGSELACFIIGHQISDAVPDLIAHGADKVYVADDPRLACYLTLPYTRIAVDLIKKFRPSILLLGATSIGRDMAPRIASHMKTGLTANCTDLQIGGYTYGKKIWENVLLQIRPAFGVNVIATIVTPETRPQMATVREGVFKRPLPDSSRRGQVVRMNPVLTDQDLIFKIVERVKADKKVNLKSAKIIVSGGMGVGSKENFEIIHELAGVLGGEVGATRAAVDAGFIGREHQVGQTGTIVRPNLYLACGISGAIQHRAGIQASNRIVAINTDPQAPIFSIAQHGIIGDVQEIIPKMIQAYKNKD